MLDLNRTILGRLAIAFAIVFGLAFYPSGSPSSHMAESVHALQTALDVNDHGHSHFDEDEDVEAAFGGHEHKHNPADHSHETVHDLAALSAPFFGAPKDRIALGFDQPIHGLTTTLDRPPRPTDIA